MTRDPSPNDPLSVALRIRDNRQEAHDRAAQCKLILERCAAELARIEDIPDLTTDNVNAFSMAKGFVERACAALPFVPRICSWCGRPDIGEFRICEKAPQGHCGVA